MARIDYEKLNSDKKINGNLKNYAAWIASPHKENHEWVYRFMRQKSSPNPTKQSISMSVNLREKKRKNKYSIDDLHDYCMQDNEYSTYYKYKDIDFSPYSPEEVDRMRIRRMHRLERVHPFGDIMEWVKERDFK